MYLIKHVTSASPARIIFICAVVISIGLSLIASSRPLVGLLIPVYALGMCLLLARPDLVIALLVVFTSTIFALDTFPQPIAIGNLGLYLSELLVVLLFCRMVVEGFVKKDYHKLHSPVLLPVLLLFVWIAFSALHVLITQKATVNEVFLAGRGYIFYLTFFLTLYYLDTSEKLWLFFKIFIVLAAVCSVLSFVQYILGPEQVLFPWINSWQISRMQYSEDAAPTIARIMPISITVIYMAFFAVLAPVTAGLVKKGKGIALKLFILLALLAFFVSFTRNVYYSVIIGVFIIWMIQRKNVSSRTIRNAVTGVLLAIVIAYIPVYLDIIKVPNWWELVIGRQGEVIVAGMQTETFAWRSMENTIILLEIVKSPIIGNGIGVSYYHPLVQEFVTASHNGFYSIVYQMGIIGLSVFAWIFISFIALVRRAYLQSTSRLNKNIVLGFCASFIALLPAIWVKSVLVQEHFWIALLGMLWAMPSAVLRSESDAVKITGGVK